MRDGEILALAEEKMERGQDRRLMPMIVDVMRRAGVDFPALDRIAVTKGPGSFTGIRIGLAAARGIGLAADKPVIGIDRFSIYRAQIKTPDKNLLVVIDSKRAELFCRFYPPPHENPTEGRETNERRIPRRSPQDEGGFIPGEPSMLTAEEIGAFLAQNKNTIVAGDGVLAGLDVRKAVENEAVTAASLAARAGITDPAFLPRPLYIRAPDVTVARKTG